MPQVILRYEDCTFGFPGSNPRIQTTANYLVSIMAVYEVDFPGGIDNSNVKWRAIIWALSEAFFIMGIAINYLPREFL